LVKIKGHLQLEDIAHALSAETKEQALNELAAGVAGLHPGLDYTEVLTVLQERERLGSTGIGNGIAIPHGKLRELRKPVLAFGRSLEGIDFDALDGRKVHLFFLLLAPEDAVGAHLKMLARISRMLQDPAVRQALVAAPDAEAIFEIIREQDNRY